MFLQQGILQLNWNTRHQCLNYTNQFLSNDKSYFHNQQHNYYEPLQHLDLIIKMIINALTIWNPTELMFFKENITSIINRRME